jgi:2-C-methyl-D-erythritol 4-phosphate cytidylyltransferase
VPQFFRYELLLRAHREHPVAVTDDAAMLEAMDSGEDIPGDKRNIKVTTPEDLELVRALLAMSARRVKDARRSTPRPARPGSRGYRPFEGQA